MARYRMKPQAAVRLRTIILILVIGYFSYQLITQEIRLHKQDTQLVQLEEQLESLQESNARLQEQLEYTQSDAYREEFARDDLNMSGEGDIQFEENTEGTQDTDDPEDTQDKQDTQEQNGDQP
jgi:cell division protein FtsB